MLWRTAMLCSCKDVTRVVSIDNITHHAWYDMAIAAASETQRDGRVREGA
jgi:hypothetical protein